MMTIGKKYIQTWTVGGTVRTATFVPDWACKNGAFCGKHTDADGKVRASFYVKPERQADWKEVES